MLAIIPRDCLHRFTVHDLLQFHRKPIFLPSFAHEVCCPTRKAPRRVEISRLNSSEIAVHFARDIFLVPVEASRLKCSLIFL